MPKANLKIVKRELSLNLKILGFDCPAAISSSSTEMIRQTR